MPPGQVKGALRDEVVQPNWANLIQVAFLFVSTPLLLLPFGPYMSNSDVVISPLVMDRDLSLGNSSGIDGRGRIHTKISNKSTEPVPVTIVDSEPGDPVFYSGSNTTSPGVDITLIDETISQNQTINRLEASCRVESLITLSVNGDVKATKRTSAASPNTSFEWEPRLPILNGSHIIVTVKARAGSPITDAEAYLMALITT